MDPVMLPIPITQHTPAPSGPSGATPAQMRPACRPWCLNCSIPSSPWGRCRHTRGSFSQQGTRARRNSQTCLVFWTVRLLNSATYRECSTVSHRRVKSLSLRVVECSSREPGVLCSSVLCYLLSKWFWFSVMLSYVCHANQLQKRIKTLSSFYSGTMLRWFSIIELRSAC